MSVVSIGKEALSEGFMAGSGTIGTTEGLVSPVEFPISKHIIIRATAGNSGTIKVGRPGNATNGFILAAGEQTPPIYVDATSKVAIIGSASGQGFSWLIN